MVIATKSGSSAHPQSYQSPDKLQIVLCRTYGLGGFRVAEFVRIRARRTAQPSEFSRISLQNGLRSAPVETAVDMTTHEFEVHLAAAWPSEAWQDLTVLVAVSGGADSVGLLRGLATLKTAG